MILQTNGCVILHHRRKKREVNTIGSKSADLELGRSVIALKGYVDRFKEQVENVE